MPCPFQLHTPHNSLSREFQTSISLRLCHESQVAVYTSNDVQAEHLDPDTGPERMVLVMARSRAPVARAGLCRYEHPTGPVSGHLSGFNRGFECLNNVPDNWFFNCRKFREIFEA